MQRAPASPRPGLPPASLGLAGLWALLETQAIALREGRADDLPAPVELPPRAAPGAKLPLQLQAYGFPTAVTLAPLAGKLTVTPAADIPLDKVKLPPGFKIEVWAAGLPGAALGLVLAMTGMMLPSSLLAYAAAHWGHRNRERRGVRAFKQGLAPTVIGLLIATGTIMASAGGVMLLALVVTFHLPAAVPTPS